MYHVKPSKNVSKQYQAKKIKLSEGIPLSFPLVEKVMLQERKIYPENNLF